MLHNWSCTDSRNNASAQCMLEMHGYQAYHTPELSFIISSSVLFKFTSVTNSMYEFCEQLNKN